jgi:hypothetical protein
VGDDGVAREGEMFLLLEDRFRKGAAVLLLRRDEHDVDVSCSLAQPPNAKPLGPRPRAPHRGTTLLKR